MSETQGFHLDRTTARAWSSFQARLADHLAGMEDGETLVVDVEVAEPPTGGAAPYVRFTVSGDGSVLRGEVSSNEHLAEGLRMSRPQTDRLLGLGWGGPTVAAGEPPGEGSADFFVDVSVDEADRVAVMTVAALRDVVGVTHPAFLHDGEMDPDPDTPKVGPEAVDAAVDPCATAMAESEEHLQALVDAALVPLFGSFPEKDADGDIPVPYGSSVVYVRVESEVPVVSLFSIVARDVTDLGRARFEVNVLNRDVRFVKFTVVDDRVLAHLQLPAWPFVPEHLRSMLTMMSQKIDEVDEDLVARVGGQRALEPPGLPGEEGTAEEGSARSSGPADTMRDADVEESLDQALDQHLDQDLAEVAMQTLLQLDAHEGAVEPELVASVCGHDPKIVVRLLHLTEEQESVWREERERAVSEDDPDETAACEHELRAWRQTTELLRRTLRLVVERRARRQTVAEENP